MTLMRVDPFNRMMRRFLDDWNVDLGETMSNRYWAPPVDIKETDNELIVKAEIPGMKLEEIDIELSGDSLCIRGERKFEEKEERDNYVRLERSYGQFSRTFTLGIPYDAENVKATYKDGILTVTLPKSPDVRPRKVRISDQ